MGVFFCRSGETQCDIVVATPGRLVDHINKTPGFDLKYLRFLVRISGQIAASTHLVPHFDCSLWK